MNNKAPTIQTEQAQPQARFYNRYPVVSGLFAACGIASFNYMAKPAGTDFSGFAQTLVGGTYLMSPLMCAGSLYIGIKNLRSEASKLSKVFAGVAIAASTAGLAMFANAAFSASTAESMASAPLYTIAAVTAASVANTIAHYKR